MTTNLPAAAVASRPAPRRAFDVVLANARSLQQHGLGGEPPLLLTGRKFAVLTALPNAPAAALFCDAATALGAHVAQIRPPLDEAGLRDSLRRAARTLGRLYDAVECQGLDSSTVREIELEAGVPVFDGLACEQHPTAALISALEGGGNAGEKRRLILQAALIAALV